MTGLVLAGTYEAREICEALGKIRIPAVASLAGVTRKPENLSIETRIGGFGGTKGFREFLTDKQISWVIDATHPFATEMTKTAVNECLDLNIPHVIVQRLGWLPEEGDDWRSIDSLQMLDEIIPRGSVVFLGTGRQVLSEYSNMDGRKLLCRVVDEPSQPFPFENGEYLVGRPPFSVQEEVALFKKLQVDWLVVKNSGGSGGASKLVAARQLGIPVAMLNRPELPKSTVVLNAAQALKWLQEIQR
jgi:precorrin-6A/cobalt-precorrin-6A reductase